MTSLHRDLSERADQTRVIKFANVHGATSVHQRDLDRLTRYEGRGRNEQVEKRAGERRVSHKGREKGSKRVRREVVTHARAQGRVATACAVSVFSVSLHIAAGTQSSRRSPPPPPSSLSPPSKQRAEGFGTSSSSRPPARPPPSSRWYYSSAHPESPCPLSSPFLPSPTRTRARVRARIQRHANANTRTFTCARSRALSLSLSRMRARATEDHIEDERG